MSPIVPGKEILASAMENVFLMQFGIAEPLVIDYLTRLLHRFQRTDVMFSIPTGLGKQEPVQNVCDMLSRAQTHTGRIENKIYRHVGDFTLFCISCRPQTAKKLCSNPPDSFLDYSECGKRSYFLASQDTSQEERKLCRILSREFDLFAEGLSMVHEEIKTLKYDPGS